MLVAGAGPALLVLTATLAAPVALAAPVRPDPARDAGTGRPGMIVKRFSPAQARQTLTYWTPERMAKARPAPAPKPAAGGGPEAERPHGAAGAVPPVGPSGRSGRARATRVRVPTGSAGTLWPIDDAHLYRPPLSTTGALFYRNPLEGVNYVCSATTVNSGSRNLVYSAGHCLFDRFWQWNTEFLFIPHYLKLDGTTYRPYGGWTPAAVLVPGAWINTPNLQDATAYDMGMLAMFSNQQGQHVVDVVGGQGMGWNQPQDAYAYAFGYPYEPSPKYDGGRLVYCDNTPTTDPGHSSGVMLKLQPCDQGHGASGGPWLAGFDPDTGLGTLTSGTSNGDVGVPYDLGPWFTDLAHELYDQAKGLGTRDAWVPVGQRAGLTTGMQIQNLDDRDSALRIDYVNADGTLAGTRTPMPVVPAHSSYTSIDEGPAGFSGSVRITPVATAVRLAVTVNHIDNARRAIASSAGFTGGAHDVRLPLLMHQNGGYSTWFAVQNLGRAKATVTVTYRNENGVLATKPPVTIAPDAAQVFDQDGETGLPPVFAALVASDTDVAVTVFEQSATTLFAYDGFPEAAAATKLVAPLVMAANGGFLTGIQVQNTAADATDVTVTYAPNIATTSPDPNAPGVCGGYTGWVPSARTRTVAGGASETFLQTGEDDAQFGGCTYLGAATITAAKPLVAVVNQVGPNAASAYEAFNEGALGNLARLPLLQANNGGTWSGLMVQNTGEHQFSVDVNYGPNTVTSPRDGLQPCANLTAKTLSIPPGAAVNLLVGGPPGGATRDPQFNGCVYVGSAEVKAPEGAHIAVMVNQLLAGGGYADQLSTYDGQPDVTVSPP